jgi:hypothetical protein
MLLPRRKFLLGLGSLLAAPAIVKAASLMPIKVLPPLVVPTDGSMCLIYDVHDLVIARSNSMEVLPPDYPQGCPIVRANFYDITGAGRVIVPAHARAEIVRDGNVLANFQIGRIGGSAHHGITMQPGDSLRVDIRDFLR